MQIFERRQQMLPLPSGSFGSKKSRVADGDDIRSNPTIFFGLLGIVICCEMAYQQLMHAQIAREHEFPDKEIELFHSWSALQPAAFENTVASGDAVLADDGDNLEEMLLPDGKAPEEHELAGYEDSSAEGLGSSGPGPTLKWEAVLSWNTSASTRLRNGASSSKDAATSAATVTPADLHGARWADKKLPKVACVTVVPRAAHEHAWIEHFIDNFRMQHYEGAHELIVVYHQEDVETRHLVHEYASGLNVRTVAVNDTDLPSTAAFRYGAWVAGDADVIARWDFEARYHSARLEMQVQALALTARPACRLGTWAVSDSEIHPHKSEGNQADGTLIGEASWMRRHWFPILDGSGRWQQLDTHQLALVVDAPELATYAAGGQ